MSSMGDIERIQVRCVVVGAAATGKSTFVDKLTNGNVSGDYAMTNRVTIRRKSFMQTNNNRAQELQVAFVDCPGKHLYQTLIQDLYKKLPPKNILVVVFDVTNRASIAALDGELSWLGKPGSKSGEQCGVLVANKIDLVDKRIVSSAEGQQKAKILKLRYFECSALTDITVQEFDQLIIDLASAPSENDKSALATMRPLETNLA